MNMSVPLQKEPWRASSPEDRYQLRPSPDIHLARALVIDYTASKTVRNQCLIHSVQGTLLQQCKQTVKTLHQWKKNLFVFILLAIPSSLRNVMNSWWFRQRMVTMSSAEFTLPSVSASFFPLKQALISQPIGGQDLYCQKGGMATFNFLLEIHGYV